MDLQEVTRHKVTSPSQMLFARTTSSFNHYLTEPFSFRQLSLLATANPTPPPGPHFGPEQTALLRRSLAYETKLKLCNSAVTPSCVVMCSPSVSCCL